MRLASGSPWPAPTSSLEPPHPSPQCRLSDVDADWYARLREEKRRLYSNTLTHIGIDPDRLGGEAKVLLCGSQPGGGRLAGPAAGGTRTTQPLVQTPLPCNPTQHTSSPEDDMAYEWKKPELYKKQRMAKLRGAIGQLRQAASSASSVGRRGMLATLPPAPAALGLRRAGAAPAAARHAWRSHPLATRNPQPATPQAR